MAHTFEASRKNPQELSSFVSSFDFSKLWHFYLLASITIVSLWYSNVWGDNTKKKVISPNVESSFPKAEVLASARTGATSAR